MSEYIFRLYYDSFGDELFENYYSSVENVDKRIKELMERINDLKEYNFVTEQIKINYFYKDDALSEQNEVKE